jgi:hypothetical protein
VTDSYDAPPEQPKPKVRGPRSEWGKWRDARTRRIEKPRRLKLPKK